jgi:Domain of unknown function (DUF4129)
MITGDRGTLGRSVATTLLERRDSSGWSRPAIACAGLIALIVVTAIAARASLSSPTQVNGHSAQTPIVVAFLLLLGTSVIACGALLIAFWPGRRTGDDEHQEPQPRVHWLWKVAALAVWLGLAAALVAAAESARHRLRAYTVYPGRLVLGPSGTGTVPRSPHSQAYAIPSWLPWTLLGLLLVAVLVVVCWLLLADRRTGRDGTGGTTATGAAVQAALSALESTADPRSAVIAAYAAMERTLAAHGLGRSPAEAPREYLRRVLVASSATEREATTLTASFEEARFSLHPITEQIRDRALAALSSMRSRLEAEPQP